MTRTDKDVSTLPESKDGNFTAISASDGIQKALKILEGRWKIVILFNLFGETTLRFSELERLIPAVSQKMLIQQLRQMEKDGVVQRIIHH